MSVKCDNEWREDKKNYIIIIRVGIAKDGIGQVGNALYTYASEGKVHYRCGCCNSPIVVELKGLEGDLSITPIVNFEEQWIK